MTTQRRLIFRLVLLSGLLGQLALAACDSTPGSPTVTPVSTTVVQLAPTEVTLPTPVEASATSTPLVTQPSNPTATETAGPTIAGKFQANGRSLYIECLGTGSPTIVMEPGEGQAGTYMGEILNKLAERTMTCSYDRANTDGSKSGSAPTPRTAQDIADDLHGLLAEANVPGPYLLVGSSAGGMLVQLYAREFPEQVAGVVAMNPVPPAHPWLDEVEAVFTPQELADEKAYYDGENGESLDYATSSEQITQATAPQGIPFEMIISTDYQCEGAQICLKSYKIYEQIERDVATAWPQGKFSQVQAQHLIYEGSPDTLLAAVDRIIESVRH